MWDTDNFSGSQEPKNRKVSNTFLYIILAMVLIATAFFGFCVIKAGMVILGCIVVSISSAGVVGCGVAAYFRDRVDKISSETDQLLEKNKEYLDKLNEYKETAAGLHDTYQNIDELTKQLVDSLEERKRRELILFDVIDALTPDAGINGLKKATELLRRLNEQPGKDSFEYHDPS